MSDATLQPWAPPWRRSWRTGTIAPLILLAVGVMARILASRYYRLEWLGLVASICWALSALGFAMLGRVAFRSRSARIASVAGCLLALLGIALGSWAVRSLAFEGERAVTMVVQSADLRHELVVESFSVHIDPAHDVWLREREGLFAREVLIWTSREGPEPRRVAFVEHSQIEVVDWSGDTRRSSFDPATLRVSQQHCLGTWCPKRDQKR